MVYSSIGIVLLYIVYSVQAQGSFESLLRSLKNNRNGLQPLILGQTPQPPTESNPLVTPEPAGTPAGSSAGESSATTSTDPPPVDVTAKLDDIATHLQQLVSKLVSTNSQLTIIVADLIDVRAKLADAAAKAAQEPAATEPAPPSPPEEPPAKDPCSAPRAQDITGLCPLATCRSHCDPTGCRASYRYGISDLTALCTLQSDRILPLQPTSIHVPQPRTFLRPTRLPIFIW